MTDESEGSRVHRHPDAADCPDGLGEEGAAAVRDGTPVATARKGPGEAGCETVLTGRGA